MNGPKLLSTGLVAREALRIANERLKFATVLNSQFENWPVTPLSPRERMQRWFSIRWDRILLAYRVLRGDDVHEDCDR